MDKMITTTHSFEGYHITEYFGIISVSTPLVAKLGKGGVDAGYDIQRNNAIKELWSKLPDGANAIIGLRTNYVRDANSVWFFADGTAVHIEAF